MCPYSVSSTDLPDLAPGPLPTHRPSALQGVLLCSQVRLILPLGSLSPGMDIYFPLFHSYFSKIFAFFLILLSSQFTDFGQEAYE